MATASGRVGDHMSKMEVLERTDETTTIRTAGKEGQTITIPHTMPMLPVRNIVVFPGTVVPLSIERLKSRILLDEVMAANRLIGVVAQRNVEASDPQFDEFFALARCVPCSSASQCLTATVRSSCTAWRAFALHNVCR